LSCWNIFVSYLVLHIYVYKFITKNGAKMKIFRVLSFFCQSLANSWEGVMIFFSMHIWNCSESQVTYTITCSIFSLSHILKFHSAKNDPLWTLSFKSVVWENIFYIIAFFLWLIKQKYFVNLWAWIKKKAMD